MRGGFRAQDEGTFAPPQLIHPPLRHSVTLLLCCFADLLLCYFLASMSTLVTKSATVVPAGSDSAIFA